MKTRNTALKLIALLAIVTTGAVWSAAGVSAAFDSASSTGMFGVTRGQTARLNVFGVDNPDLLPIRAELSLVDGDGQILSQKVFDIETGKSAFLDLKGSDVPPRDGNRIQMRAVVKIVDNPDIHPADALIPTLEVFDNKSGETRFLLPAVQEARKVSE